MKRKKLSILLITRYFPPEIGTAANLFYELASGLSQKGHDITVITNFPWYNIETIPEKNNKKFFMKEYTNGFKVVRVTYPVFGPKKFKLALGHLTAPIACFFGGLINKNPDIIFSYSPPIFMGITGWLLKLFKSVPFVLGVQDLHPQCYIDQGVLKNKLLIFLLENIEKFCYNKSSSITVHSEGNKIHLTKIKGINKNKIKVIPNWVDTDEMQPLPRENDFSKKYNLNNKFIVGYAGTFGMSQGMMSIIEAANILRDRKKIEFFLVGNGIEREKMMKKVEDLGLRNVRFLGMQPKNVYPYIVASSDIQLVTLNSKVKTPVIPSKILSIMAGSRPILASIPLHGDAPKLISKANCGECIPPEDPKELAVKIVQFSEDKKLCDEYSSSGYNYVIKNFSLKVVVKSIEDMFNNILGQS